MRGLDRSAPGIGLDEGEIDLAGMGRAFLRSRWLVGGITAAAFAASVAFVLVVKPRYTGEAKLLVEMSRFDQSMPNPQLPDPEAVVSQVQVIRSRDLARTAIDRLSLKGNPEFDPAADPSLLSRLGALIGRRGSDTSRDDQIIENFLDHLNVTQVVRTRVLQIEFTSSDADFAARAANTVSELYIEFQTEAKRRTARATAASLGSLVADLRTRVAQAETKAEEFRASSGLVMGSNNVNLSSQQVADITSQLALARGAQAEAQAKAKMIRDMLRQGRLGDVSDVANNDLVRRIAEQRVSLRAQIAAEGRTLGPEHPRIKELNAQLAGLESDLQGQAEKVARTLENDSKVSVTRVANLLASAEQQRKALGGASVDEAQARDLDRAARLLKDQLEATLTKYQDATARETSDVGAEDARIISRAVAPVLPSFPRKLPLVLFATLSALVLSAGGVLVAAFVNGAAIRPAGLPFERPQVPGEVPMFSGREARASRLADAVQNQFRVSGGPGDAGPISDAVSGLMGRIAGGARGGRAQRILVTAGAPDVPGAETAVTLGRTLAGERPAILVELGLSGVPEAGDPPGLYELLEGRATFDQAIHRDRGSRLHLLTCGAGAVASGSGLDIVLEALSQTYDYVILLAPPAGQDELTRALACTCDFAVLACSARAGDPSDSVAYEELRTAGAPRILAIAVDPVMPDAGRQVA
jgi:uncharacterized protein involved in exopolysaccharide biosynthesis/Mrp family chromosome partitioning ATPase